MVDETDNSTQVDNEDSEQLKSVSAIASIDLEDVCGGKKVKFSFGKSILWYFYIMIIVNRFGIHGKLYVLLCHFIYCDITVFISSLLVWLTLFFVLHTYFPIVIFDFQKLYTTLVYVYTVYMRNVRTLKLNLFCLLYMFILAVLYKSTVMDKSTRLACTCDVFILIILSELG